MNKFKEFQKENPDTKKYCSLIMESLKKDRFEDVFHEKMEDNLKSHLFDEDYQELSKELEQLVELHLFRKVIHLFVDPTNNKQLDYVLKFMDKFKHRLSKETVHLINTFSQKQKALLSVFNRWENAIEVQENQEIVPISVVIPENQLSKFNQFERDKIQKIGKTIIEAKQVIEKSRENQLKQLYQSKAEVLNEEEQQETENQQKGQIMKYESDIQKLMKEVSNMKKQLSETQKKLGQKDNQLKMQVQLRKDSEVRNKKQIKKVEDNNLNELKKLEENNSKELKKVDEMCKKFSEECDNLKKQIKLLQEQKKQLQKSSLDLSEFKEKEIQRLKVLTSSLENDKKKEIEVKVSMKKSLEIKEQELQSMQRQKDLILVLNKELISEKNKINKTLEQKKQEMQRIIKEQSQSLARLDCWKQEKEVLMEKIKTVEADYDNKSRYVLGIEIKVISLTEKNTLLQQKLKQKEQELQQMLDKLQKLSQENCMLQKQINQQYNESTILESQVKEQHIEIVQKKRIIQLLEPYEGLFSHQILFSNSKAKNFISKMLASRYNQEPRCSKLLCKLDPFNNTNLHRYIDDIPNLLVLIELKNGRILGGFSVTPFHKNVKGEDSLIFSVTEEEIFNLNSNFKQAIVYDEYFLIFGNSELRIKTGDAKCFSNLGVSAGYFNTKGRSVNTLLGEGSQRQTELVSYELYQVFFSGP